MAVHTTHGRHMHVCGMRLVAQQQQQRRSCKRQYFTRRTCLLLTHSVIMAVYVNTSQKALRLSCGSLSCRKSKSSVALPLAPSRDRSLSS